MNDNQERGIRLLLLLIKSPFILKILAVVLIVFFILFGLMIAVSALGDRVNSEEDSMCSEIEIDETLWENRFENTKIFKEHGDAFYYFGQAYQVDPVLLASIALYETNNGNSPFLKHENTPSELYNNHYEEIEDAIHAFFEYFYNEYTSIGMHSIHQISHSYAPYEIPDPEDEDEEPYIHPNAYWVQNVQSIIDSFGGLSMECNMMVGDGSGEFMLPLYNPRLTSPFGLRLHPIHGDYRMHNGMDFACTSNEPIFSVATGKVAESKLHNSWGNYVVVQYGNLFVLYAHLNLSYVSIGDTVNQGQLIGACGSTGDSTGPHLHLEIHLDRIYGARVNPLPYFSFVEG